MRAALLIGALTVIQLHKMGNPGASALMPEGPQNFIPIFVSEREDIQVKLVVAVLVIPNPILLICAGQILQQ